MYRTGTKSYYWELVFVGSAGHLPRYKVVDESGTYVKGGLFRTMQEADAFIAELSEDPICPGHPADEFSPMGETQYCDGSCQTHPA